MALILFAAIILGWRVNKARRQAKRVAALHELNSRQKNGKSIASPSYFHEFNNKGNWTPNAGPLAPRWLRKSIGLEFFPTVRGVNFASYLIDDDDIEFFDDLSDLMILSPQGNGHVTDASMSCLLSMTKLGDLWLECTNLGEKTMENLDGLHQLKHFYLSEMKVMDLGLSHVRELVNLRVFWFGNLNVTDAGLVHLEMLDRLELLNLNGTKVTDSSLVYLESLKTLHELDLGRTSVTLAGIDRLGKRLPKTRITNCNHVLMR